MFDDDCCGVDADADAAVEVDALGTAGDVSSFDRLNMLMFIISMLSRQEKCAAQSIHTCID